MIDLEKVRKAIEVQREIAIEKLVVKSENGEELSSEELDILESFYENKVED